MSAAMVSSPGLEPPAEPNLDDRHIGGPALSDDEDNPADENSHPNLPVPTLKSVPLKAKLAWVSVGIYEGPECAAHAQASLKMHAQDMWFEPKARKGRGEKISGIPLTRTPRILADGTVISEFRCPFSQVLPDLASTKTCPFLSPPSRIPARTKSLSPPTPMAYATS